MEDFYNAVRRDITMIRGDSMAFNFQLQGLAGAEVIDIKFTCKEHYDDEIPYFTKSLTSGGITVQSYDETKDITTYCCRVSPEDTENLDLARFYYDLELTVGLDVITLMKGRITIEYDVTN
mgnify:CR=1 FL=1